jgi:hypothetical protein
MKRIYGWITKANQVLLFFPIIGAGVGISYLFYDLYRTRHIFDAPSVAVSQTPEEAKPTNVVQRSVSSMSMTGSMCLA